MAATPHKRSVSIKYVADALNLALPKVDVPTGEAVDTGWSQISLVNPPDTGNVIDCAIAQHTSKQMIDIYHQWHHQVALIIGGEMVAQDMDTGEVYRAHKGDLFYWAPGRTVRLGGTFRAFAVKTPIPLRWVETPAGKKEVVMHTLEGEILLPGSPPDQVRQAPLQNPLFRKRLKFVRGALDVPTAKVDQPVTVGEGWSHATIVSPRDSDNVLSVSLAERKGGLPPLECDHRWHEVALVLDGELVTERTDTGEAYKANKGDVLYFGNGLLHTLEGEFRIFVVRTPDPMRWLQTSAGLREMNLLYLENELQYPASPPDEIAREPLEMG